MASLVENALTILRVMLDRGITPGGKEASASEIKTLAGLNEEDFQPAHTYLLHSRKIEGAGNDEVGSRWITPEGIDYMEQEMSKRVRLTLNAERLLKYITDVYPPGGYEDINGVKYEDVQEKLNLDRSEYDALLQELEDTGLAESSVPETPITSWYARPTAQGRQLARQGFRIGHASVVLDPDELKHNSTRITYPTAPSHIQNSLADFKIEYPDPNKVAFIMMRFSKTPIHLQIAESIKNTLAQFHMQGVRADDREYHSDLFPNVQTYVYGCAFGIAVFDQIEANEFNPNVSLEVGYMLALGKPICILKDRALATLQTDLMGKLYKSFDPQDVASSISNELSHWLRDNKFGNM